MADGRQQPLRTVRVGDEIMGTEIHAMVEDLGLEEDMIDITTGTGDFIANGVISHNCFARPTHNYLDFNAGEDFDSQIVVKVNVADVLRRELARPSWSRHPVALGTNTDPYQRAESRYKLMPDIIAALADTGTPFSILTNGTLLARDIPVLKEASRWGWAFTGHPGSGACPPRGAWHSGSQSSP